MPSLGADMNEGALVEWLVQPGDTVVKGQPIAVVDTAKSAIEVECFEDGVIKQLLVEPGTTVPVGTVLAVLGDGHGAERIPEKPSRRKHAAAKQSGPRKQSAKPAPPSSTEAEPEPASPPAAKAARPAGPAVPRVSPLVRRLARDQHIDLGAVHGSGPGGRVTRADVDAAVHDAGRVRATPTPAASP